MSHVHFHLFFPFACIFFLILVDDLVSVETLLLFEVLLDGGGLQFVETPIAVTVVLAALTFDPCALEAFKAAIFFLMIFSLFLSFLPQLILC